MMSEPEPFVGIEEAAAFLAVKVSYIYEQCRLGRIPSYKVGAFRRFRLSELAAWATRGRATGTPSGAELVADSLLGRQEVGVEST